MHMINDSDFGAVGWDNLYKVRHWRWELHSLSFSPSIHTPTTPFWGTRFHQTLSHALTSALKAGSMLHRWSSSKGQSQRLLNTTTVVYNYKVPCLRPLQLQVASFRVGQVGFWPETEWGHVAIIVPLGISSAIVTVPLYSSCAVCRWDFEILALWIQFGW